MLFDHGLCVTPCSAHFLAVTETGGHRKLNHVTTPGVSMNGRCIYCHPEHDTTHSMKEEEDNWEDAATVPVEEVETGEDINDQSLHPVISLDGIDKQRFVGFVLEGTVKKGRGWIFEGRGSLRNQCKGYSYEGQWKKSEPHGHSKVTFERGDMYEGEMKSSMRDGRGTYTWANGNWYEGK
eukprot:scaffold22163_cov53-Attheya_sp.AAC.3